MEEGVEITIPITKEVDRFQKHLELPYNSQMIFSGIFGIGKTYFIKEFFKQKDKEYEIFLLSPVNYSIASTDDIIEYIKYDITFQLFGKDIDFEKEDFSVFQTTQYYVKDNFLETMSLIAKMVPKVGKVFGNIFDNLKKLKDNLKKHNEQFQIDEKQELFAFLEKIKKESDSIYEENRITELICGLIEVLKTKDKNKKVVLVIDDLDRLDPEHIFRIMNVFACHFDLDSATENKFGFDKIILVCDIENIRTLFHSKYGLDVDFSGYIDKFYSREIFYFDNKRVISEAIRGILSSITTSYELELRDSNYVSTKFVRDLIKDLVLQDILNLRLLLKVANTTCLDESYSFRSGTDYQRFHNRSFRLLAIFDLLLHIFGSKSAVSSALEKLAKRVPSKIMENNNIFEIIIEFLDYKNHRGKKESFTYRNLELDLIINYAIEANAYAQYASIEMVTYFTENKDEDVKHRGDLPFAPLLKLAYEEYLRIEKI